MHFSCVHNLFHTTLFLHVRHCLYHQLNRHVRLEPIGGTMQVCGRVPGPAAPAGLLQKLHSATTAHAHDDGVDPCSCRLVVLRCRGRRLRLWAAAAHHMRCRPLGYHPQRCTPLKLGLTGNQAQLSMRDAGYRSLHSRCVVMWVQHTSSPRPWGSAPAPGPGVRDHLTPSRAMHLASISISRGPVWLAEG